MTASPHGEDSNFQACYSQRSHTNSLKQGLPARCLHLHLSIGRFYTTHFSKPGHVIDDTPCSVAAGSIPETGNMSHLQRSFAKAKLTGLPLEPPLSANALREEPELEDEALRDVAPFPDSAQEDDSPSASSASSASSTGTIKPNSKHFFARPDGFVHFSHFNP